MPVFDFAVEQILSVHDGDTCSLLVDLGFGVKYDVDVRLEGIDTPEINIKVSKAAAIVARDVLVKWLNDNRTKLRLFSKEWDKYGGRALGSVYIDGQRSNTASAYMIAAKVARPYNGTKKAEWTKAELATIAGMA